MRRIAFVFPGQGAQYVGMGKELFDNFEGSRKVFQTADNILKEGLRDLCFNGPEEELLRTENTQPAILATSIAAMEAFKESGFSPEMTAGLSLGEYSALVSAGSLNLEDAIPLVRKRGRFMQDAVPMGIGAMAAIIGLDPQKLEECCKLSGDLGSVAPANFNCPGQIVISGHKAAVEKACALSKEMGAKRAIMLSVSAPFHSSLLIPAGEKLSAELENIQISSPKIPVISNVYAQDEDNPEKIRENLVLQVSSPVRWEDSIRHMIDQGIDTFIEMGPGKVLTGFIKKISKDVRGFNIEDMATLEKTLEGLVNQE